ncbi:unnamed protein product [Vicia faba]|uniref:Uncharacterized protein n=1 Tax=Vicia faba TaxID=3906 RepID=A0AAV1AX58_VICFA|nr:unnamed protein product [Vicia faba]
MQEIQTSSTSLIGIRDTLLPFNLLSSPVDQMTLLEKSLARKEKSLASSRGTLKSTKASLLIAQGELQSLQIENDSLTQWLADCMISNLGGGENLVRGQRVTNPPHPLD